MNENTITIHVPPQSRWLPLVQDGVHRYAAIVGFSDLLKKKIMLSVMEACEELVRWAERSEIDVPFTVLLDYKNDAIFIDITYAAAIRLNPSETEEYEVPDAKTDIENITVDALWLHLLKKNMDRVFFRVRGKKRVLSMILYQREEGKEKRAWAMALKPKLKKGLELYIKDSEEEHPSSVLQKVGTTVLILNPSETFFVQNMDGTKTLHDIYIQHVDSIGLVSPHLPIQLYEHLERMGMLSDSTEETGKITGKQILLKLINPSFSIPHSDAIVTAIHNKIRFLFSPIAIGILLLIGLSGFYPLWDKFHHFLTIFIGLEKTIVNSPHILICTYILVTAHVLLHELGHGVVCKHYGGRVPRIGIMFYLAFFIFFCDTTAAYTFPKKYQRILVSLGGPIVSFVIFGIGLWCSWLLCRNSPGGIGFWESTFVLFSVSNVVGLFMNFNPFIKMDAYYMLLDFTEIQNLRQRSFAFIKRKLFGWLGFGSPRDVRTTHNERNIFWWYGILGGATTLIFFVLPIAQLNMLLKDASQHQGRLLFVIGICSLICLRLGLQTYNTMKKRWAREYILKK
ncbi:hypothetical protein [Desulfovibrio inopinatus]|uniref:hypothetical protein n=1 Tax=Desulfovibrio inopinatus TaxID=102109 RepID=UPI00041A4CE3|nr:hypothetical protein [Desulfovibrio inopinatus]